jgi:hypothetical protein
MLFGFSAGGQILSSADAINVSDGIIEGPATCYWLNGSNIGWYRSVVADIF